METIYQVTGNSAQNMAQSAAQTMSDMKNKAQEWGSTMTEKATNAATSVGHHVQNLLGISGQIHNV